MTNYASKPTSNIPIALRLVPRIMGWSVQDLARMLLDQIDYLPVGNQAFYLNAYQWNGRKSASLKPVTALTIILRSNGIPTDQRAAISTIPPDLFVYSDNLEAAYASLIADTRQTPRIFQHEQMDWQPNCHGIEDLIEQCPEPIRTICPLAEAKKARSRDEGKSNTKARNLAIQKEFDKIKRRENQKASQNSSKKPSKVQLCRILEKDRNANPDQIRATRLERIVKMN